nr:hypothetical protein [Gammaproteobacteria bacterium]
DDGVGEAVEHGIALNTREPIHVKVVVDALRKFAKHNGIEDIEYKTWADEFPGIMRIMTVLSILERLTLGIVVALQMVIVAAILIVILSLKRARFVLLEVMAVDRSWIYGQVGKVILFFSSVGLIVGAFSAVLITMSLEGFLRSRRGMLQVGELNGEFAAAFDPLTVVLTIAAFLLCIVFSSAATISVWLRKVPAVEIREVGSA